ncbi:SMI1/KNR4 family protein [Longimicrobium sp.]|uniref:SMI1/KNR4 family protein n=1 Tax=Longimicrobium sp. TaxID=2029185 RepID=UPI002ED7FB82
MIVHHHSLERWKGTVTRDDDRRMLEAALDRIADKVRRARERDLRPFGAESRGIPDIRPPLSPGEVAAVEARLGVALPEEYRGFITRVGDGGAGPAYGLFSLAAALREAKADAHPQVLAIPFPHVQTYNPDEDPEVIAFWDRADAGEVSDDEQRLQGAREAGGTLPLCDEGCGYLHLLVVTGPTRGTMWVDSRGADAGFIPLNVTFLDWYERWIDDVLAGGRGTWWFGDPVYPPGHPQGPPA